LTQSCASFRSGWLPEPASWATPSALPGSAMGSMRRRRGDPRELVSSPRPPKIGSVSLLQNWRDGLPLDPAELQAPRGAVASRANGELSRIRRRNRSRRSNLYRAHLSVPPEGNGPPSRIRAGNVVTMVIFSVHFVARPREEGSARWAECHRLA
jgi:hypothetical protein